MLTPTITSSLTAGCLKPGWCADEFRRSKVLFDQVLAEQEHPKHCQVHLKYTLPSPMTVLDQLNDGFYGDDRAGRRRAAQDLVKVLAFQPISLS